MGFNNGYDSGYDDAKTEFALEKAALERRIRELEAESAPPFVPLGVFGINDNELMLDITFGYDAWLAGSVIKGFSEANGDKVTISSTDDDSDAVDMIAAGSAMLVTPDTNTVYIPESVTRVLGGEIYALVLICSSANWYENGVSLLNDSSNVKLNITINGTTVSYRLVQHS